MDLLDQFVAALAKEIFIADGGVEDFDAMTESEVRVVVYRELNNTLGEMVVAAALKLQDRG